MHLKKQIGGAIYTLRDIHIKGHTRRGHTYMVERRNIPTEKVGSDSGGKGYFGLEFHGLRRGEQKPS